MPVVTLIVQRLPATLLLMACAFLFSVILGVLLGVIAARARYNNRRRWIDSAVMAGSLLFYATPLFWLAPMAILLFSVSLGWLPGLGMDILPSGFTGWDSVQDN